MIRPTQIPYNAIRQITLLNVPSTQQKTVPYNLPDLLQLFSTATLSLWYNFCADNFVYTYDPSYILEARLNLYSLDVNGAQIEQVIVNGDLPAWGCTPMSGTIHGNKYWSNGGLWNCTSNTGRAITGPVYICGWQTTTSLAHGSGTMTLPGVIRGLFTNFS